jgi:O-acetyl-ADP-ribose deacetylase
MTNGINARPGETRARIGPAIYLTTGDICDQRVDAIVNAWNRNIIPWWLLLPSGVSGAIKKKGGWRIFRELGRQGPIPLGGAVATGPGRLPCRHIIHVAGIDLFWRSSERSIRDSTRNALRLARELGARTLALPLIGAGAGGRAASRSLAWMLAEARPDSDRFDLILIVVHGQRLFENVSKELDASA